MNNNYSRLHIAGVILAAGKGKRMNLTNCNKVTSLLGNKPIILHIVQFMQKLLIETVIVVIGHAKESVQEVLRDEKIIYAEQIEQLGTGDALACAVDKLPKNITDVFVVYGDDGIFYSDKHLPIIKQLFDTHSRGENDVTFVTIEQENPQGLGRILRSRDDEVLAIVEEKDATEEQKMIKEINPGCFIFSVNFLKEYLPKMEKSTVTGEYYLTSLIDLAIKHGKRVETVKGGKLAWRGVNTPEELAQAEALFTDPFL